MIDERLHNDCDGGACCACAWDAEQALEAAAADCESDPRGAAIRHLARRCAMAGRRLRDARALFHALYRADALMLEGGSVTRAAQRAGVGRETLNRHRLRDEMGGEE